MARGRRPGESTTRSEILAAASRCFANDGYDRSTYRHIAAVAGVDPALITYHFGSKRQLLMATLDAELDPAPILGRIAEAGPIGAGHRLIQTVVEIWENTRLGARITSSVHGSVAQPESLTAMREFISSELTRPLLKKLGVDHPDERAGLIISTVLGLHFGRYVFKFPELTALSPDRIAADLGPTLERYINEPLGEPAATDGGPARDSAERDAVERGVTELVVGERGTAGACERGDGDEGAKATDPD